MPYIINANIVDKRAERTLLYSVHDIIIKLYYYEDKFIVLDNGHAMIM